MDPYSKRVQLDQEIDDLVHISVSVLATIGPIVLWLHICGII